MFYNIMGGNRLFEYLKEKDNSIETNRIYLRK